MMRSKVSFLPPELRKELERRFRTGTYTQKQLHEYVNSRGGNIKRTSLRYYLANLNEKMQRYREAQEIAAVWVAKLGSKPEGDVGRLLLEMLRTLAFRQLAEMGDSNARKSLKTSDIVVLAKAIREMEAASKSIAERETRLREKIRTDLDRKVGALKPNEPNGTATLEKAKELVRGLL